MEDILHVVVVISNPAEYARRAHLFEEFVARYENNPYIELHTMELQYGRKPFGTSAKYKLRTDYELWHKENLINLTVQKLPDDWRYMAWIDADIEFHNQNWAHDTLKALQHYRIVQLFSHAIDLGPNDEAFGRYTGFGYDFCQGRDFTRCKLNYQNHGHTGYAWAITRSAYNGLGRLLEFAILGSGDAHIAHCLVGCAERSINPCVHEDYKKMLNAYQDRCQETIKKNIGYVKGTILHHWHGKKRDRRYVSRWKILVEHQFSPITDIDKDWRGLWKITENKPDLCNAIRIYFRTRNEDSVDLE